MPESDIDTALLTIGYGCGQLIILAVSFATTMFSVTESMGIGYVIVRTSCEWSTSREEKTFMASALLGGMVASGFFLGFLADRYGRKFTIRASLVGALIFSFVTALMPNQYAFSTTRIVVGLFLSGSASLAIGFLIEFHAPRWRPKVSMLVSFAVGFALVSCPLFAMMLLPQNVSVKVTDNYVLQDWRFLVMTLALPGIVALISISFVPETPYFLLSAGRMEEAIESLKWVAKMNGKMWDDLKIELTPLHRDTLLENMSVCKELFYETFRLFRPPFTCRFVGCLLILFGVFFNSVGMGVWYPIIRNTPDTGKPQRLCDNPAITGKGNHSSSDEDKACNDQFTNFHDPIFYGCAYLVFYAVATVLVLFIPRRYVMALHIGTGAILGFTLNFVTDPLAVLLCFTGQISVPGVLVSLSSSVMVDLLPVHMRGKALCLGRSLARLGSVVGSILVGLVMKVSCNITINIFVVYLAFCTVVCLLLPKGP
ncbi:putative transporter SVOPL isoform X1 [Drosophila bipectinata]|uniref:putative transporter SVOPL isoform X1 n=2 Tax=Drosophila bipectinata TaxID=42026 RepID=UPI0038B2936C